MARLLATSRPDRRRALRWAVGFALLWIVDAGDADGFAHMGVTTLRRIDSTTAPVP